MVDDGRGGESGLSSFLPPPLAPPSGRLSPFPDPQPQPSGSPWSLYWNDLRWCLSALKAAPLLFVLSFGYWVVADVAPHVFLPSVPSLVVLLVLLVSVFWAGFVGVQRVWFLRLSRDQVLPKDMIFPVTASFMGRFILLGLLMSIPWAVVSAVAAPFILSHVTANGTRHVPLVVFLLPTMITTLVLDVLLTFVTPALALSTSSVIQSLRLGIRMIGATWPSCAWYVIAPGLTLTALAGLLPNSWAGWWTPVVVGAVSTFLGLWFKGATVGFYVRAFPGLRPYGSASGRLSAS